MAVNAYTLKLPSSTDKKFAIQKFYEEEKDSYTVTPNIRSAEYGGEHELELELKPPTGWLDCGSVAST
jgi:hypothetical protein